LADAQGWTEAGAPLSGAAALDLAASDALANDRFYAGLLAIVRDNLPPCD
jgi:hypothetical protein